MGLLHHLPRTSQTADVAAHPTAHAGTSSTPDAATNLLADPASIPTADVVTRATTYAATSPTANAATQQQKLIHQYRAQDQAPCHQLPQAHASNAYAPSLSRQLIWVTLLHLASHLTR